MLAALICLALAWMLNRQTTRPDVAEANAFSRIETQVDSALNVANRDALKLESLLQAGNHNFRSLLKQTTYPSLIFEDDELLFWSEEVPLLDFENVQQLKLEQFIESKFGKYLVVKRVSEPGFTILVCIPLEVSYGIENKYLVSGLNPKIFGETKAKLLADISLKLPEIYSTHGTYLFSIQLTDLQKVQDQGALTFALVCAALLLFFAFLYAIRQNFRERGFYGKGVLIFLAGLLVLRILLLLFNFPYAIFRPGLFDPKYYAASFWSPSVGDLLLNGILLATMATEAFFYFRKTGSSLITGLTENYRSALKLVCLAVFFLLYFLIYRFYGSVYTNSLLVLDINQSLDFGFYKLMLLLAILIHSGAFLLVSYLLISLHFSLPKFRVLPIVLLFSSLAVLCGLAFLLEWEVMFLAGGFFLFTILLLAWESGRILNGLERHLYIFGFLLISLSAFAGAIALYQHYQEQLLIHKQKFAQTLTQDNDVLGEYLLEEVAQKVSSDPLIRKKLMSPIADEAFIRQKIVKYYLRDYFEKYETDVKVYDPFGNRMKSPGSVSTLAELRQQLQGKDVVAKGSGLFLIKGAKQQANRQYLKMIRVQLSNSQQATVLLELNLKKLTPHSVIPELLVDEKYSQPLQSKAVSYAAYKNGKLQFSDGDFDYFNGFDPRMLANSRLFLSGRTINDHHHYAVTGSDGVTWVISTVKYLFRDIWSNACFLFLLHVFFYLGLLSGYMLWKGRVISYFKTSFSTKIQLFLNVGILLPLLLISISIGSLVTASYKRDLVASYEKKGRALQENISTGFRKNLRDVNKTRLENLLTNYAGISETDLSFYDTSGKLLASSQPLIFEAGLMPQLINPLAFAALTENKQKRILLSEKAGLLNFSSLYMPVYSASNGRLEGFISMPFFDSEKELNQKLIQLTTTIMNIFTVMFIGLIFFSFLVARILTVPLNLITEKLKRTTLTGTNERLNYTSADEIGLLVQEYNVMITKLEESKNELALKEKEAAWREMARQVAHEIKNPLTPMKLSLQYLQKAIAEKRDNVEELISKISQTLITNIDILSDIATSFSTFTALPDLKNQRIALANVLKKSIDLNFDPANVAFETAAETESLEIIGDENLLTRTFNNLFLNALQAIPAGREPFIKVHLQQPETGKMLVTIQDNGSGIPAEVQAKVFVPNFSTKYSGSGIGLAVAKKGIESAGGKIWFETKEDEGTKFYLEFPVVGENYKG